MSNRKILIRSVVASAGSNEETLLFAKNAGKGTSLGGGDVDVTGPA